METVICPITTRGRGRESEAVGQLLHPVAVLVNQSVVPAAEQHQIPELRLTAMCPVDDVMAVHVAAVAAAKEAIAGVDGVGP